MSDLVSERSLAQRLVIRPGNRVAPINAPTGYREALGCARRARLAAPSGRDSVAPADLRSRGRRGCGGVAYAPHFLPNDHHAVVSRLKLCQMRLLAIVWQEIDAWMAHESVALGQ